MPTILLFHVCGGSALYKCCYGLNAEIVLWQMREFSRLSCDLVMSERRDRTKKKEKDSGRERKRERERRCNIASQLMCAVLGEKPRRRDTCAHSLTCTDILHVREFQTHMHELNNK